MAATQQNPSINWESKNLRDEWRQFEQHAKLMFKGPLKKTSEEEKATYILLWVGTRGREIFNSWNLNENESKDTTLIYRKFQKHTEPKSNVVFSRYKFYERKQKSDESFENFVTDIHNLLKDCAFDSSIRDEMVRDRIVTGIYSDNIREKLLNKGDTLTLETAIEVVNTHETTQQHLSSMSTASKETDIDAIKSNVASMPRQRNGYVPQSRFNNSQSKIPECGYCGNSHSRRATCPAYGQTCSYCSKLHHFEKVCRMKKNTQNRGIHSLEESESVNSIAIETKPNQSQNDTYEYVYIDSIGNEQNFVPDTAYADIKLETGDIVKFKVDTGAQTNVLPLSVYKHMNQPPPLTKANQRLQSYTGQSLDVKGKININCSYRDHTVKQEFIVVDIHHSQPILGLKTCLNLNIIKLVLSIEDTKFMTKDSVLKEFQDTFTGLGNLEGEITIHLKPDATPVVHPPRRVPFALRDKLQAELKRMEDLNVIEQVTIPTDWVNSLVTVEKPNGDIRICLDPKDLNENIKRPHYSLPTLEDALAKMSGAQYFSKLDAKSGYWMLKLDEQSSYLTTFNTPFGRYRFKRLPFGLICAQDVFQRKMDEVFEDLNGVTPLIDDVIITGRTREEHDANLRAALTRATEKKLKLNPDKLTVGAQEVKFFGHLLTADGLKPDPDKVKAIVEMPAPKDKKELQTMLGMITYLSKFAPQLSETTKPLRDLLKDDVDFSWDKIQQSALDQIKKVLTNEPVLAYYDPSKPVTLQVDSSKFGCGATIFQDGKPVAYASKSLNETEQNYAQIEKELYAIVFGCTRFHQFIYGRKTLVESDHKPLEIIFKKSLTNAPPRLQRMLLQLQKYDIIVKFKSGKKIPVADTLSRKFLPADPNEILIEDLDVQIHSIIKNLPVSDQKITELRTESNKDNDLLILKEYAQRGWPDKKQDCNPSVQAYWTFREEISCVDGILLKGDRIIVPKTLKESMLDKLHSAHFGVEKTTQRARQVLYWPGMTDDINKYISSCNVCAKYQQANAKEPMQSHEIPSRPWQKVATDIFTWNKRNFMVTVDYYSRFWEIDELNTTTSQAVIRKLSTHFARYGIPEILISDNGSQYTSQEFQEFCQSWDFQHITSSPGYSQSNGLAEKTVQTAKRILEKSKESNSNPLIAILEYRSTPVDNLASPAQLLMGRQLRSTLPTTHDQLEPKTVEPQTVIDRREKKQLIQQTYYNRTAHALPELRTNQNVRVQLNKGDNWIQGKIQCKHSTPRSYIIETEKGNIVRRNRRFIKQ